MKNYSFVASRRSFYKLARSRFETYCFSSNNSFEQMFIVSSRGMLVNNEVMSGLVIKQSELCIIFVALRQPLDKWLLSFSTYLVTILLFYSRTVYFHVFLIKIL